MDAFASAPSSITAKVGISGVITSFPSSTVVSSAVEELLEQDTKTSIETMANSIASILFFIIVSSLYVIFYSTSSNTGGGSVSVLPWSRLDSAVTDSSASVSYDVSAIVSAVVSSTVSGAVVTAGHPTYDGIM